MDMPAAEQRRLKRRVPLDKRRRALQACHRCKARKSRCIIVSPGKCERCQHDGVDCITDRGSTEQWLQTVHSAPQIQEAVPWTNGPDVDQHSTSTRSPGQASEPAVISSHLTCADAAEYSVWPRYFSKLRESFALESHAHLHEQYKEATPSATQTPLLRTFELRRLREAIDGFPPRDVAQFLIVACIDYAPDSFFYFNRAKMLSDMDDFYENRESTRRSDPSFLGLAHAVFSLGSQWIQRAKPKGTGRDISSAVSQDGNPGQLFLDHARSLVPDLIEMSNLQSVQALFILGTYLLPVNANNSSHMYLGLALRKAVCLDLHKETDPSGMSEDERETRRRIWWSVYALERCSTVKLNRPKSINAENITTALPKPHQPIDSAQKFDNINYQIANAQLMLILDEVAVCADNIPSKAKYDGFDAKLIEWKQSLPWFLDINDIDPDSLQYRARFHLCLNYYFAYITMGKASMVTTVQACLRDESRRDTHTSIVDDHVKSLQHSCIEAASRMLHMFEDLHQSAKLEQFSFTDFQGCSIATVILLLASIIHHRSASYEKRVSFGLDCLRGMAQGHEAAKLGVSFVEGLQAIAIEARGKRQQSDHAYSATQDNELHTIRYNKWLEWVSKQRNDDLSPGNSPALGPNNPAPDGSSWSALDDPHTAGLSSLQPQYHSSVNGPLEILQDPGDRGTSTNSMDAGIFSGNYEDEHTFLMNLTGMDIFGFPEPNG